MSQKDAWQVQTLNMHCQVLKRHEEIVEPLITHMERSDYMAHLSVFKHKESIQATDDLPCILVY